MVHFSQSSFDLEGVFIKFAFMPKTKCVKFVLGKSANPHSTESVDLYKRIVEEIGEEKARFDGYYDIPLILEVRPGERN